jgi:hypothetical protein
MAKESNIFDGNPLTVAVLVVGGIYAANLLFTNFKKGAGNRQASEALNNALVVNTNNTNISVSEAQLIANQLYVAMDGAGTDYKTIKSLLIDTPRSADDLKLITKAFGVKEYGTFGSPLWGSGDPYNLVEWLKAECSSSELSPIAPLFRSAGIPF